MTAINRLGHNPQHVILVTIVRVLILLPSQSLYNVRIVLTLHLQQLNEVGVSIIPIAMQC